MISERLIKHVKACPIVGAGLIVFMVSLPAGPVLAAEASTRNMTIDQRLSRIERMLENQSMVEVFMQLQTLQREVESLRGELEVLSHDISGMKQRQKDLYLDLDNRIQSVEMSARNAAASAASVGGFGGGAGMTGDLSPGVSGAAGTDDVESPMREQESYQSALTLLKDGKYQEAVQQFQILLISYPKGEYSDNAQYWMGEAYYVMRDFKSAIVEFAKVVKDYPASGKLADSYLKIGFAYYELQDWKNARQSLEKVIAQFPSTTAARLAERRLQQMKLEGRS